MTNDSIHGCDESGTPLDPLHPWNREGVPDDQCPVCGKRHCPSRRDDDFWVRVYRCDSCAMTWPGRG